MKREIVCDKGARQWAEIAAIPSPGEDVKIVFGKARSDYLCDACVPAHPLPKGTRVAAVSVFCTDREPRYFRWEDECLEQGSTTPATEGI